jgi:hypothetical protein
MAIRSHVLSAPLTLATLYNAATTTTAIRAPRRLCCVGARAEATLPYEYWKEFLLLASVLEPLQARLDFVGPDIPTSKQPTVVALEDDDSSLSLEWHYKGLLHDEANNDERWDAYIFFNPGLGHDHLEANWRPTLEKVIEEKRPMLLTAHSELDAMRDSQRLGGYYGLDVQYSINPFASRVTYEDPFDRKHIVRPNHYVAYVFFSDDT